MWIRLALVFASGCFLAVARVYGAEFIPLGDLSGGDVRSQATAISGNGQVVVGTSSSAFSMQRDEAFLWTADDGLIGLGALPSPMPPPPWSSAYGVSYDGSVVVGRSGLSPFEAFRWSAGGGLVGLGVLPGDPVGFPQSIAWSTSADGAVVVGQSGAFSSAFRWTAADGMVPLGSPPGETVRNSSARDVSPDGAVIVGSFDAIAGGRGAYRWTSETGMVPLGGRSASAVSADGSVVVGFGGPDAFRWTEQSGRIGLGDLPGGRVLSIANDVSADGSIIVGFGETAFDGSLSTTEAFFWTQATGMVNLGGFLTSQGLDLTGWALTNAEGISADGRTVVGTGINPAGNQEAWIATIPEPSTLAQAGLAALVLCSLRFRQRLALSGTRQ